MNGFACEAKGWRRGEDQIHLLLSSWAIHLPLISMGKWATCCQRLKSTTLSKYVWTARMWTGKCWKYSKRVCKRMWESRLSASVLVGCIYSTTHLEMDANLQVGKLNTNSPVCAGCTTITLLITKILRQQLVAAPTCFRFCKHRWIENVGTRNAALVACKSLCWDGTKRWTTQSKSEVLWGSEGPLGRSSLHRENGSHSIPYYIPNRQTHAALPQGVCSNFLNIFEGINVYILVLALQ